MDGIFGTHTAGPAFPTEPVSSMYTRRAMGLSKRPECPRLAAPVPEDTAAAARSITDDTIPQPDGIGCFFKADPIVERGKSHFRFIFEVKMKSILSCASESSLESGALTRGEES